MNETEIMNKVVEIITPYCKKTETLKDVKKETKILQDLGVNSARLVDIILAFEDEFNIEIDDDTADRVQTVGDAVEVILSKK